MDERVNTVPQPENFNVNLYQHQLAIIYMMEKRENEQRVILYDNKYIDLTISINADITGYGKTLSMLGLIYRDKMEWDNSVFTKSVVTSMANGNIKTTTWKNYDKLNCTLVLVNNSIINQWYEECKKTPLKVIKITTNKLIAETNVNNYDVVLVSPTMYNNLIAKYFNFAWKRFIFDEPGHLKISSMRHVVAGFIWFITATPNSILYKHRACRRSFMYDIFKDYYYGQLEFMTIKNDDEFVKNSYQMPLTKNIYYKCHNPIYNTIKDFVASSITNMISAGNIQDAIKALGGNTTDNITELVKKIKTEEIEILEAKMKIFEIRNRDTKPLEDKIQSLQTQINEIDMRYNELLTGDCSICFDKIRKPVLEPNCQNIFCGSCFLEWLKTKNSCPLCRVEIKTEKLTYINTDGNFLKDEDEKKTEEEIPKTKIETVVQIIKDKPNGKFILFSGWDNTFDSIRKVLMENDISFTEIKGSITTREKSIQKFKNGEIKVIFLNSNNNGSGINLQEASDLIIYHDMTDNIITQIVGRANRIGRQEPLTIHYLKNNSD